MHIPDTFNQEVASTVHWQTHSTGIRGHALLDHHPTWTLYLNSFSVFPRRSRTSQWELKASWGGMPQRMMAFKKAFLCLALKPRTWPGWRRGVTSG